MKVSLILAVAENGVIGRTGTMLPWRLPTDLARFKQLTLGHPIIMGRKTYETIGRPLPGRHNIIISRNPGYKAEGCVVAGSLDEALKAAAAEPTDEAFVTGGSTIYERALDLADTIYLTKVHASPDGDVFFRYDPGQWQEIQAESHPADERNQYPYTFITLNRKRVGTA